MSITVNINTSFISGTDTPLDYQGAAGKKVVVNSTEDGLIFVDDTSSSPITHYVTIEELMSDLMTNSLSPGHYYVLTEIFNMTYKAIDTGDIEPFRVPIYKPIEVMYQDGYSTSGRLSRGVLVVGTTYNEGDHVIFFGKVYVKTSGGSQVFSSYPNTPEELNSTNFNGWEEVLPNDLYILKNFKFEMPLKHIQMINYIIYDDYSNVFKGIGTEHLYLSLYSDNRKDIYDNECIAINNCGSLYVGGVCIVQNNRIMEGRIYNNSANYIHRNSIAQDIHENINCEQISDNSYPCNMIAYNIDVLAIEYNNNSGLILGNESVNFIIRNSNVGGIYYNFGIDRIESNNNNGDVGNNSKLESILRNSNNGNIKFNFSGEGDYWMPVISYNSNNGDIGSYYADGANYIKGSILLNSNLGSISGNNIVDATPMTYLSEGESMSTMASIAKNNNEGNINFNDPSSIIFNNSNLGDITGNIVPRGILANSNHGSIFDNDLKGGGIEKNSNGGDIGGNYLGDETEDYYGGSISLNSNTGDITNNQNFYSSDGPWVIGVNSNVGDISSNGTSFMGSKEMIIYQNSNNGSISKNDLAAGVISFNSNNGPLIYNAPADQNDTEFRIIGNCNNGQISNTFIDSSIFIEYNTNNGEIFSNTRSLSLIETRNNI